MRFAKKVEKYRTEGGPLCEQAGNTVISYVKYDFTNRGEGFPVEHFYFYDPTEFPDRDIARYAGGYRASIDILMGEDGSIYPQISIIQGNKSYSIWDGQDRKGNSGLPLLKVEELNEQQKIQIKTVLNLLRGALPTMIEQNPNNPTFRSCANFFGLTLAPPAVELAD